MSKPIYPRNEVNRHRSPQTVGRRSRKGPSYPDQRIDETELREYERQHPEAFRKLMDWEKRAMLGLPSGITSEEAAQLMHDYCAGNNITPPRTIANWDNEILAKVVARLAEKADA